MFSNSYFFHGIDLEKLKAAQKASAKFKCPYHGDIEKSIITLKSDTPIYKYEHDYCAICFDEFVAGKRTTVNRAVKK